MTLTHHLCHSDKRNILELWPQAPPAPHTQPRAKATYDCLSILPGQLESTKSPLTYFSRQEKPPGGDIHFQQHKLLRKTHQRFMEVAVLLWLQISSPRPQPNTGITGLLVALALFGWAWGQEKESQRKRGKGFCIKQAWYSLSLKMPRLWFQDVATPESLKELVHKQHILTMALGHKNGWYPPISRCWGWRPNEIKPFLWGPNCMHLRAGVPARVFWVQILDFLIDNHASPSDLSSKTF